MERELEKWNSFTVLTSTEISALTSYTSDLEVVGGGAIFC